MKDLIEENGDDLTHNSLRWIFFPKIIIAAISKTFLKEV